MSDHSNIEWTDATWNPTVGCSVLSPGCTNCYAMKMAARLEAMGQPIYAGMTQKSKAGAVWTGKVELSNWGQVIKPLSWKKPRKIFVNSMSDLFHESLPDEAIDKVFAVMALCPQHTFQVLTKRTERMRDYICAKRSPDAVDSLLAENIFGHEFVRGLDECGGWPLDNVWLGVSTERQQEADERIPLLLQTPAAVRFISAEPLLGPIDLTRLGDITFDINAFTGAATHRLGMRDQTEGNLDWVIVGGESGPGARPMHPEWARSLRDQCEAAGISFFFKQWGQFSPVEVTMAEWLNQKDPRYLGERVISKDGEFSGFPCDGGETCHVMRRLGKKSAGRLLDGLEHNAFPITSERPFE